jgi:hypothetical protein
MRAAGRIQADTIVPRSGWGVGGVLYFIRGWSARACSFAGSICAVALLAGCSNGGLLETPSLDATKAPEPAQVRVAEGKPVAQVVAFRAPLGPPDDVGAELTRQLDQTAAEQSVALIVDGAGRADHMLRGYVTAMRRGPQVNVTWLWDVLDTSGKRLTRISGDEMLKGSVNANQPWSAVTPAVSRVIAQRTMAQYLQWARANATPAAGVQTAVIRPAAGPALAASPAAPR